MVIFSRNLNDSILRFAFINICFDILLNKILLQKMKGHSLPVLFCLCYHQKVTSFHFTWYTHIQRYPFWPHHLLFYPLRFQEKHQLFQVWLQVLYLNSWLYQQDPVFSLYQLNLQTQRLPQVLLVPHLACLVYHLIPVQNQLLDLQHQVSFFLSPFFNKILR